MHRRLFFVLLLFLGLAGCGQEPETRQWRFALEEIEGSVQHAYAKRFKELVEKRTDGAVEVAIYPYGSLGTSADVTEQVQTGAVQFAFASPGHLGSVVPESQVFSLHFLFPRDEQTLQRVFGESRALYGELGDAYADKGLSLLAVVHEGWMVWTADRALETPADFEGLKIRTMVSPLLLEAYRAYGANPTPMPYGEVYSALQLNMIDAQVNPVFAIEEMSFYEVQEVMTFADHLPFVSTVVANPAFLDGLPERLRRTVREVKAELDDYIFELQDDYNAERLDRIREQGDIEIVRLTAEQRQAFAERARPLRQRYTELAGERGRRILEGLEAEF